MQKKEIAIVALSAFLISSCSSAKKEPASVDPLFPLLAETAIEIKENLIRISEQEQIRNPNASEVEDVNEELQTRVSKFEFIGEASEALDLLSKFIGYKSKKVGSQSFPTVVVLDFDNTPVIDILRSIGAQVGEDIDLVVSERYRELRLEYK